MRRFSALILAATLGLGLVAATPAAAATPAVGAAWAAEPTDNGDFQSFGQPTEPNRVVKQIDLTEGDFQSFAEPFARPEVPTGPVYCTYSGESRCLQEPDVDYVAVGCDEHGDYVFVVEYRNKNRRQAPVDTDLEVSGVPFGDTGLIPAANSAGPGTYRLEFRLPSGVQITVKSGWSYQPGVQIGKYRAAAGAVSC